VQMHRHRHLDVSPSGENLAEGMLQGSCQVPEAAETGEAHHSREPGSYLQYQTGQLLSVRRRPVLACTAAISASAAINPPAYRAARWRKRTMVRAAEAWRRQTRGRSIPGGFFDAVAEASTSLAASGPW
jgi:hypothetical protein